MEKTKEYLNGWLNAIEDVKKNAMVFVRPSIERYPREYIDGYYAGRNAFKNAKAVSERSNSEEKQKTKICFNNSWNTSNYCIKSRSSYFEKN